MRKKKLASGPALLYGWIQILENQRQTPLIIPGCTLLLPAIAFGDEPQKNILVFYSDDVCRPANVLITPAIRSTLKEEWKFPIEIYDEGLDSFRIPDAKYEAELVKPLQRKYEGVHLDLIFAIGPPTLTCFMDLSEGKLHRKSTTNETGRYQIISLPVGEYRIEVRDRGFQTVIVEAVCFEVGRTITQNFQLAIGDVSEQVVVTPSINPIEHATVLVGHLIDRRTVQEIPLSLSLD